MRNVAVVGRLRDVVDEARPGALLRARRKKLGLTGTALAGLAEVSREHLSSVESGHKEPTAEWLRRVELAMDRYEHETGQDEVAPDEPAVPSVMRVEVQGVYGAKALVFEAPVENIAELEAMVDRVMRRLATGEGKSTSE